jgi:hypothetical protein
MSLPIIDMMWACSAAIIPIMEISEQFAYGLIKGKIAELIFELMFREAGKFNPIRSGYEYTVPELTQYRGHAEVERVLDNISNAPDFVLISKERNGNGNVEVFTVEVKYRARLEGNDIVEMATKVLEHWDPSWLFIATLDGFYFAPCNAILNNHGAVSPLSDEWIPARIQKKYLEILRDFEIKSQGAR